MKIITQRYNKFWAVCIVTLMILAILLPVASASAADPTNDVESITEMEIQDGETVEEPEKEEKQKEADDEKKASGKQAGTGGEKDSDTPGITDSEDVGMMTEAGENPTDSERKTEEIPEQEMSLFADLGVLSAGAIADATELQQKIDELAPGGSADLVLADAAADFVIDTAVTIPAGKTVSLDINGRTVKQQKAITVAGSLALKNSKPVGMIIRDNDYKANLLAVTGSLTTSDIVIDGGAVWGGAENSYLKRGTTNSGIAASSSLVAVSNAEAAFQMNTGTVLRNNIAGAGGGVSVSAGVFTMEGGEITRCADNGNNNGGAVYMTGGSFVMNNGKLTSCSALRGGAVSAGGTFAMNGGEIKNNATFSGIKNATNGGGVLVTGGSFALHNGTISDNYAKDTGGGISVSAGVFTMEGGTVSGNKATNGGGVSTAKSPGNAALFLMTGGTIASNSANYGGGVQNNSVYSAGYDYGGATYNAGTIIAGGTIKGNTAAYQGGGVHADTVYAASQVVLLSGNIIGNKTTSTFIGGGGGLYLERGTSGPNIVRGVTFQENTAANAGGGIYVEYSANLLEDLTVSGNQAKNGGGVYIVGNASKPADVTLKESVVTDNTATNSGGGVYLNKSGSTGKAEFIMAEGSKIYDNEATASGNDYTAVAGCMTTLLPAADMSLPGRNNWFEDKNGARYIDADNPVVYPVVQQDTSALDLTLGIVHTVIYLDGFGGAAFVDDVHENLPHNSDTPTYSGGTPMHEGHTFTGWDLAIAPKVTEDATYTAQWEKNKHTVTYNDGVDGEEVFADDVHTDIPYGDPTPAFTGAAPMREGYTFTGWLPEVDSLVTKDITYRAGWKKDSNPEPTPTPTSTPNPGPTPPAPCCSTPRTCKTAACSTIFSPTCWPASWRPSLPCPCSRITARRWANWKNSMPRACPRPARQRPRSDANARRPTPGWRRGNVSDLRVFTTWSS